MSTTSIVKQQSKRFVIAMILVMTGVLVSTGVFVVAVKEYVRRYGVYKVELTGAATDRGQLTESDYIEFATSAIRKALVDASSIQPVADKRASPDRYIIRNDITPAEVTVEFVVIAPAWPNGRQVYVRVDPDGDDIMCVVEVTK